MPRGAKQIVLRAKRTKLHSIAGAAPTNSETLRRLPATAAAAKRRWYRYRRVGRCLVGWHGPGSGRVSGWWRAGTDQRPVRPQEAPVPPEHATARRLHEVGTALADAYHDSRAVPAAGVGVLQVDTVTDLQLGERARRRVVATRRLLLMHSGLGLAFSRCALPFRRKRPVVRRYT